MTNTRIKKSKHTHVAKKIRNEDSNRVQTFTAMQAEQPKLPYWQERGRYRIMKSSIFWDVMPSSLVDFHRATRRYVLEDRTIKNGIYFVIYKY
jgi:hypothetical protein